MSQKRKLQVFVSSTYTDLKEERQAAVEAILKAGHIPAGMELFAAGDQSQMEVIHQWIDESDVYLLLLGGRYGSIEPNTGKSYTHLEYEYALNAGKPLFAVVINEQHLKQKVKEHGVDIIWENENPQKLKDFRTIVTGKLVEFWSDLRDIKLAIHTTLADFERRPELTGWVRGNEAINTGAIAEELAKLTKENADLRNQIKQSSGDTSYNGLNYSEVIEMLSKETLNRDKFKAPYYQAINDLSLIFSSYQDTSLLHFFCLWGLYNPGQKMHLPFPHNTYVSNLLNTLTEVNLMAEGIEIINLGSIPTEINNNSYHITQAGYKFLLRLKYTYDLQSAGNLVAKLKQVTDDKSFSPFKK